MEHVPTHLSLGFALITLVTVWLFYKAAHKSKTVVVVLLGWLLVQAIVGLQGFFAVTTTTPPRFLLLVLPPLLFIAGLFITQSGRRFIDGLDIKTLTILHTIRIFVELILLGLYLHKVVPQIMTFEGRNFDILSGITAPIIFYLAFIKKRLHAKWLLMWNFICLVLLINIVVHAILSAPFPFQQFAFDQPNIAILHFPFIWLPGCVVPVVLLSHLAAIRQLIVKKETLSFPESLNS